MQATDRKCLDFATTLLAVGLGTVCVYALFDTGRQYDGFEIPQHGIVFVDTRELGFYAMYALWGSLATGFFAYVLLRSSIAAAVLGAFDRARHDPRRLLALVAALVCVSALAFRAVVLLDEPVTDDESTYLFEAQTLLQGRLVNPRPQYAEFWHNQWIVLNERGWSGKYPIGHPLVLAPAEAIGVRFLVGPVLGLLAVVLTFAVGRRLFGSTRALLGACLLLVSPQFVWTHATQLSQISSELALLVGMWLMLRLSQDGRLRWACLAGIAFGFGVLVRPFPGVLFLAAAFVAYFAHHARRTGVRAQVLHLLSAAPGVLAAGVAIALLSYQQTGSALESGYTVVHKGHGILTAGPTGQISTSFAGALIRQNFWLFGWTLSLAFVPFARPARARTLFWGMIVAECGYRLMVPKTVVSISGPVYMFEIVPLLALATADGCAHVADLLGRLRVREARTWVAATMLAASMVALVTFVPVQLRPIYTSSTLRHRVYAMLDERGVERALVFANQLVNPTRSQTWAYYPPNPAPTLDDDILFARRPSGAGGPRIAYEFWRRKFRDRRAFLYYDSPKGLIISELRAGHPPPASATLTEYVNAQQGVPDGPSGATVQPRDGRAQGATAAEPH